MNITKTELRNIIREEYVSLYEAYDESEIIIILDSLINGQFKQMANQIDSYGKKRFWEDYMNYLDVTFSTKEAYDYLKKALAYYSKFKM